VNRSRERKQPCKGKAGFFVLAGYASGQIERSFSRTKFLTIKIRYTVEGKMKACILLTKCFFVSLIITGMMAIPAGATSIYLIGAGDSSQDSLVQNSLATQGYTVIIGDAYSAFSGSVSLSPYGAVLLMPGFSDNGLDMPTTGQTALLNYVKGGGGLVTTEWSIWLAATSRLTTLKSAFPVTSGGKYQSTTSTIYFKNVLDPVIDYNLSASSYSFSNLVNLAGTESALTAKSGATVFFDSSYGGSTPSIYEGVVGWTYQSGRVISLSTPAAENDLNYQQLLANSIAWADPPTPPVPEPSTLFLLGSGLAGLWFWGRKKFKCI
jgi:hypothetical protein